MFFSLNARQICCQFLFIAVMLASSAHAANWRLEPSVAVTETYYDNITLSSNNKNSEFVSQISPGFSLTAKGRRLQLSSRYTLGYVNYWSNAFSDRFYQQGSLGADLEAIKKHLFINATASVSQQAIDPRLASGGSVQAITNNRTETRRVSVSPVLRNRFGRYADSVLSSSISYSNYSTNRIGSSYSTSTNYTLSSGKWFNRLTWFAAGSMRSGRQNNANSYQTNARMDYRIARRWVLFATGRASKYNFLSAQSGNRPANSSRYFIISEAGVVWTPSRKFAMELGGGGQINAAALGNNQIKLEQKTWRAKVTLSPTSRTHFEFGREQAVYGRRLYSTFTHYTRKTNWSSTYSETLITPRQARNTASGFGGARAPNIGGGLSTFGGVSAFNRLVTDDVILRKRFSFSGKIRRRKVNLTGGVFHEKGEYQTSDQTDKRYGANAGFDVALSRKSNASVNSSLQRYYFDEQDNANNIYSFNTSLSRRLGKRANASLIYIWRKRSASTGGVNYTTNQVIAQFRATF